MKKMFGVMALVLFLGITASLFSQRIFSQSGGTWHFCGRQGDITIWVSHPQECASDSHVVEGARVMMKYDPPAGPGQGHGSGNQD